MTGCANKAGSAAPTSSAAETAKDASGSAETAKADSSDVSDLSKDVIRTDKLLIKNLKMNKVLQIIRDIGHQPVLSSMKDDFRTIC